MILLYAIWYLVRSALALLGGAERASSQQSFMIKHYTDTAFQQSKVSSADTQEGFQYVSPAGSKAAWSGLIGESVHASNRGKIKKLTDLHRSRQYPSPPEGVGLSDGPHSTHVHITRVFPLVQQEATSGVQPARGNVTQRFALRATATTHFRSVSKAKAARCGDSVLNATTTSYITPQICATTLDRRIVS